MVAFSRLIQPSCYADTATVVLSLEDKSTCGGLKTFRWSLCVRCTDAHKTRPRSLLFWTFPGTSFRTLGCFSNTY